MKIGIKYCGGCNPKYTRSLIPKKIKEEFPWVHLEPVDYAERYDCILIICGCEAECIPSVAWQEGCREIRVFSLAGYERVRKKILAYIEKRPEF